MKTKFGWKSGNYATFPQICIDFNFSGKSGILKTSLIPLGYFLICGEYTDSSDLDLLIDLTPETSLMDIGTIRCELRVLLGIDVDVLTPKALPDSFRGQVLKESMLL